MRRAAPRRSGSRPVPQLARPRARLVALALAGLGLLAAPSAARAQADDGGPDTWYAERLSTGDAPVRVEHYWSKGPWLRSETVFAGHPILTVVRGERYVIVDRLNGEGISVQRSPRALAQDEGRERPFANELYVLRESGGEKVGEETLGGRTCTLYRLTNEEGRKEVCVSQSGPELPVFLRVWLRGSGRSMETRYLHWSRDLDIPDAFFAPPEDAQIEHLSYEEYVRRTSQEPLGPAPPFHADLLHGY